MSDTEQLVGKCPVCEINVYESDKAKPFMHLGKMREGFPREVSMPCGINREPEVLAELKKMGFAPEKDVSEGQMMICPFETKAEQDAINYEKGKGIFSGRNTYEVMG